MSELRRKLVIVGDGACGMSFLFEHRIGSHTPARLETVSPGPARANSHSDSLLFRQDLPVDRLLKGNIPRGLCSNRLRKLRRRCRGRWPPGRTRPLGYRRTGGLRSSQTALLSRLTCCPYLLCYRLARLARERAGKGMTSVTRTTRAATEANNCCWI